VKSEYDFNKNDKLKTEVNLNGLSKVFNLSFLLPKNNTEEIDMEDFKKSYQKGMFSQLLKNGFISESEYIRCLEEIDRQYKNFKIA
jgi:hypothetical protein